MMPSAAPVLTPAQFAAARLVAAGLPRPEVARRLRLSPRTIDAHLRAAYRRLGVSSRRQVAATLIDISIGKRVRANAEGLRRGDTVTLVGGRYAGRTATWLKKANSTQALVRIGAGAEIAVMSKFVRPVTAEETAR